LHAKSLTIMALSTEAFDELRRAYPVFDGMPPHLLDQLRARAHALRVPRGASVFDERQACELFPLVLKGKVRVEKLGEKGRRLKLYDVAPGEGCVLTGSCLLSNVPYTARGEAVCDVDLVGVPRSLFLQLIDGFEPFRRQIFQLVAERMTELMSLVEEVAFRRLDQRLAARLLDKGTKVQVTHQQLADELGSVREIVSRILGQFVDEGLIRSGRQEIEVLDPEGLRARISS
jgi:CRP/FNR family transcriptional regulator